jgi:beta-glucosidase
VRNAGATAGAETVQLYVGDEATREVVRPQKELKAFEKVQLAPGEVRTVRFTLSGRDLAYYDEHRRDWVSTPGTHRIFVGSSSRDIRLRRDFEWTARSDSTRHGPESTAPP